MAKEISENTVVGLSLKTLGAIIAGVGVITLGYFDLKQVLRKLSFYRLLKLVEWNTTLKIS
jgi:hypothetical protein